MARRNQVKEATANFDPFSSFKSALQIGTPWDSIIDFATHKSFCGLNLYPRQQTILKLIYLETENMTEYDKEVINRWAEAFGDPTAPMGVQQDIWERVEYLKSKGYRRFPHVQAVMGRRASKGVTGGVCGAEGLAYMYSLDNWQEKFGLPDGKDGYMNCIATTQTQAKRFQFADIRQTIERCKYLQPAISTSIDSTITLKTPADKRRALRLKKMGVPVEREIASLHVVALSSNSASGRGSTTFANVYDEFAHMLSGTGSTRSSEEVYEGYQPALDQFGIHGFTYMPSSPWTKVGKFYELYVTGTHTIEEYNRKHKKQLPILDEREATLMADEGLDEVIADPRMLILQLPSWEPYKDWEHAPKLVGRSFKGPIQHDPAGDSEEAKNMRITEAANPEKFKVERRAQFAEVIDSYLNPRKVEQMFEPFWGGETLTKQEFGTFNREYRVHVDPGRSNADFALTVAHIENPPFPDDKGNYWPNVIIDYMKVWKPTDFPDNIIDFTDVTEDIRDIIKRFPSIKKFTFDQWNSAGFISMLRKEFPTIRFEEVTFSDRGNRERAEYFKSALNLGWVHSYRDEYWEGNDGCLLELELKFLSEKNGKVVKQEHGPITKKDLADTVMEVTVDLLRDQLDKWNGALADLAPSFGRTDVDRFTDTSALGINRFSRRLDSFFESDIYATNGRNYTTRPGRGYGF